MQRNRGLVFAESFLWGTGFPNDIHKINPSTGASVSSFTAGTTGLADLAYNGTNLFVTRRDDTDTREYSTAGVLQATHSWPTGRSVRGLAWDGANWWAGIRSSTDIVKTDTSFNELAVIEGPNADMNCLEYYGGHLYVMTTSGLYRRAI
jgi:hypothetical protein